MPVKNLKEIIRVTFGVDISISGGYGQCIEDPIVIEAQNISEISTAHSVLEYIYRLNNKQFNIVREVFVRWNGKRINKIRVELFGDSGHYHDYYFDVSKIIK